MDFSEELDVIAADVVQGCGPSGSVHSPVFSEWFAGGMVPNGRGLGAANHRGRANADACEGQNLRWNPAGRRPRQVSL